MKNISSILKGIIIFLIFISLFILNNFVNGQNIGRNIIFDVYTNNNLIFNFNGSDYKPYQQTKFGNKYTIVLPKTQIIHNNILEFNGSFKNEIDGKLVYININIPFDSTEQLSSKNSILIYLGKKILTKDDINKYPNLVIKNVNGLNIISSEEFSFSSKKYSDIISEVTFPNILGIRTKKPIIVLGIIVFIFSSAFLIYKKEIIKL